MPWTPGSPRCWCGNSDLQPFNADYLHCQICQTLVLAVPPAQLDPHVKPQEDEFYGKDYWFGYQEDVGNPGILPRTQTDLSERALYWLESVLSFKLPPGKALELGSAHGGFVAMLRWAGFDATGLELSPWIVDYAKRTFDVPMLLGPLEDQDLPDGSLDLIAHMDVLEHLPDPVGTMRKAFSLLKPGGLMAIQTPHYVEGRTYEQMKAENDPFLIQLKPREHLYLFSRQSITELFRRLGVEQISFEPAIFGHYDMFPFVSRSPLKRNSPESVRQALQRTPFGRAIAAMLELKASCAAAENARLEEANRTQDVTRQFQECEADRAARLQVITDQGRQLGELNAQVNQMRQALQQSAAGMEDISRQFAASEADRAARLQVIENQGRRIMSLEAEVHQWLRQIQQLQDQIQKAEAEHLEQKQQLQEQEQRLNEQIHNGEKLLAEQTANCAAAEEETRIVARQLAVLQTTLRTVRSSLAYGLLRKVGFWSSVDKAAGQLRD